MLLLSPLCFSGLNLSASPLGHRPSKCSFFNTSLFFLSCPGTLFRGLLSQCSVSMSPIAFEGREAQRGYVQLHVHTIFIPVRARSCHSLTDSYPSIHTSWSRMTRKKIPKPKARKLLDIHTPQSIDRTLRWGTICSPGCVDESSP